MDQLLVLASILDFYDDHRISPYILQPDIVEQLGNIIHIIYVPILI